MGSREVIPLFKIKGKVALLGSSAALKLDSCPLLQFHILQKYLLTLTSSKLKQSSKCYYNSLYHPALCFGNRINFILCCHVIYTECAMYYLSIVYGL